VVALLFAAVGASAAHAQSTRTWVSGVGNDANPCSRTEPCKTFAGAMARTDAKGEINVLDPGGFGTVTITKSVTISSEGFEAGVLATAGANAIVINAGPTDVVVLRGLDLEGLGAALTGIKVLAAGAVYVEDCTINNFTQMGIDYLPASVAASTSQLHVSHTILRNNSGSPSGGIRVKPGSNVSAKVSIQDTELRNNQFGLRVEDNSSVTVTNTVAANNATTGFLAVASAGGPANLNLFGCTSSGHSNGARAENPTAFVRVAHSMFIANTNGFSTAGGGHTVSFGSTFNADPGAPSDPDIIPQ
jgi:hypothetical protein